MKQNLPLSLGRDGGRWPEGPVVGGDWKLILEGQQPKPHEGGG